MIYFKIFLTFLILIVPIYCQQTCSGTNSYVCINSTSFQLCNVVILKNNKTEKVTQTCPAGYMCVDRQSIPCQLISTTTKPTTTTMSTTTTRPTTTTTSTTTTRPTTTTKPTTTTTSTITTTTSTTTKPTTTTTTITTTTSPTTITTPSTTTTPTITTTKPTTTEPKTTTPTTITISTPVTTTTPVITTPTTIITTEIASNCTKCGQLYPDYEDCFSYYVCTKGCCGNFTLQKNTCNGLYSFDPVNMVCTNQSNCKNPEPPKCSPNQMFYPHPTDPTKYYICITKAIPKLLKKGLACPYGERFDSNSLLCTCQDLVEQNTTDCQAYSMENNPEDDCDKNDTCVSSKSLNYQPFYENTPCTVEGVFADALRSSRYHVCYKDKCGKIIKATRVCPDYTNFDPINKICSYTTKPLCTNKEMGFTCTEEGLYPDPLCSKYYYSCLAQVDLIYTAKELACPPGLYWNAKKNICALKMQDFSSEESSYSEKSSDDCKSDSSNGKSDCDKSKSVSDDCSSTDNISEPKKCKFDSDDSF